MRSNASKLNVLALALIVLMVIALFSLPLGLERVVEFEDAGLEAAVREHIKKPEGDLLAKDVQYIQVLDCSSRKIRKLDGIEALIELREINLADNYVKSVSPLKNLMKLQKINLRNNEITDLEAVDFQDIIHLHIRNLDLRHNVKRDAEGNDTRLSDISMIGRMASLRKLKLRENHIDDLTPLSNLRRLTELDIRDNSFTSIEALSTLTRLEKLNLRANHLVSLEPIRYLHRLTYLNIHSLVSLESLDALAGFVNLETLIMRNVPLQETEFLRKLTKLQRLNVIDTGIEGLDFQGDIEYLLSKGALTGLVRPARILATKKAPALSKSSGFYPSSFELAIESEAGQTIYYSLDGSEPKQGGLRYTGPILIDEQQDGGATIVRAKVITDDGAMSETVTGTYFVSATIRERFDLPVISIVTDPANLFDEEIGIYTAEHAFERGSDWERPVVVELFETDGRVGLRQNLGLRIHGGHSRRYAQKSLRLYAKSEYDDTGVIAYEFFPQLQNREGTKAVDHFKTLILRNAGNGWSNTMFDDALVQSLVAPLPTLDTQAYRPSVVFINGEYYGIQNVRERYDQYYLENHYGLDEDAIVILESNGKLFRGDDKDRYRYLQMIEFIEDHSLSKEEHFDYVSSLMDVNNYRDYFASRIFAADTDWPDNNVLFWRKKIDAYDASAPYGHDGRWRWVMLDADVGFYYDDEPFGVKGEGRNHRHNTIEWVLTELDSRTGRYSWPNFLFRALMENQGFQHDFLNAISDMMNSIFLEAVVNEKIDEFETMLEHEMPNHIARWGAISSVEKWEESIDNKRLFAKERPAYIRAYIAEAFGLDGSVRIQIANETDAGHVRVNSLDINAELTGNDVTKEWTGIYFTGIPIHLEAVAKEGYHFSHWEGVNAFAEIIEIVPEEGMHVTAVFKANLE